MIVSFLFMSHCNPHCKTITNERLFCMCNRILLYVQGNKLDVGKTKPLASAFHFMYKVCITTTTQKTTRKLAYFLHSLIAERVYKWVCVFFWENLLSEVILSEAENPSTDRSS